MEFLRKREDFVDLMIKHIGTSAIMDLLLRMLTCIEPQQLRQDVLNVRTRHLYLLCLQLHLGFYKSGAQLRTVSYVCVCDCSG